MGSCAPAATPGDNFSPEETAARLTETLISGDKGKIIAFMDDNMRGLLQDSAEEIWTQLTAAYGEFSHAGESERADAGEYKIVLAELFFAKGELIQRTVFDTQGRVAGLLFSEGALPGPGGGSAEEIGEAVTFYADERYPISGLLTFPDEAGEKCPAVVLIHGSGAHDRNETIGANRVFADIADGLTARGVAVLRYDKRTYTYGAEITESEDYAKFTVMDEITDDAEAAVRFLRGDGRVDADRIYLAGHSLGAGLLSYIGERAPVAGYIVMAGTARRLWELALEQNLRIVEEQSAAGGTDADRAKIETAREFVAAETKKAETLSGMSDEDALNETIFGMPAWYLRSFEGIDPAALHTRDGRPVLILQGGRDKQVPPEDLDRWRQALAQHPDARFALYPELNHLFGAYTGEDIPLLRISEEYDVRTPVADAVIDDIAEFIGP
ncbi:MAG: alpha/beta fold hydrolase [Peptococcaceae bacterium]|nr:alpha/beta fold hydrolase [Peptococcaceae bacterium]